MRRALGVLIGSALTGVLLAAALPPSNLGFLGWICLAPLLISVRGTRFLVGFGGGLVALFVTGLTVRSGLFYEYKSWSGDPAWIVTGCTFFGFAIGITTAVWAEDSGSKRPIWWYACLAVVLEACLLLQLPGHLALTQYRSPVVLLAALGGIWLISFLVWIINLWVARTIDRSTNRAVFVASLLIAFSALDWKPSSDKGLSVGFVQSSSIDLSTLSKLHRMAANAGSTLTIWPEYSGYGSTTQGDTGKLKEYSAIAGADGVRDILPRRRSSISTQRGLSLCFGKGVGSLCKKNALRK